MLFTGFNRGSYVVHTWIIRGSYVVHMLSIVHINDQYKDITLTDLQYEQWYKDITLTDLQYEQWLY